MSTTNGSTAMPSRDEVIRLCTYYAAVDGYFDTSEAAQKAGLLTISVMDMALPEGATHRFYVMINRTGSMVTRYSDDRYEVTPGGEAESQRQERELREAVLETALWRFTGEGALYLPGRSSQEDKERIIAELLAAGPEEEEREGGDPVNHPVIRDELPDPTISLAKGPEGGVAPRVLRQWLVQIGRYLYCEVALFGYDEDGSPSLLPIDKEPDDYDEDDEE